MHILSSDHVSSGIFTVCLGELQGDSQRLSLKMVWSTGSESSEDHLKTGDQNTWPFLTHPAYAKKYHTFQRYTNRIAIGSKEILKFGVRTTRAPLY